MRRCLEGATKRKEKVGCKKLGDSKLQNKSASQVTKKMSSLLCAAVRAVVVCKNHVVLSRVHDVQSSN